MALTVLTVMVPLFMMVGFSVSSTHTTTSVTTLDDMENSSLPNQTSVMTTTSLASSHYLGNTSSLHSHGHGTGGEETSDAANQATHHHPSVPDVDHESREQKEQQLLEGDEAGVNKSSSGGVVTERRDGDVYQQDSVHHFVTTKGKVPKVVTEKGSVGSSLNALYQLYSLASAVSEEGLESELKGSGGVLLNALYVLYSLGSYVMDAANTDGLHSCETLESCDKYGRAAVEGGQSSAVHHQEKPAKRPLGVNSPEVFKWRHYVTTAVIVVSVVAILLIVAFVVIRYCHLGGGNRRANRRRRVTPQMVLRSIGTPST